MGPTTLALSRVQKDRKPAIMLTVRNADERMRSLLDTLNVKPAIGESNCRQIICATPAELDAVREPIKHLFDATGNFVGWEK